MSLFVLILLILHPIVGVLTLWIALTPETVIDLFGVLFAGILCGWLVLLMLVLLEICSADFWNQKLPWIKD